MKALVFLYFLLSLFLSVKFVLNNQEEKRIRSIIIALWFFFALITKSVYFPSVNPFPFKIRPFIYMSFFFIIPILFSFTKKLPVNNKIGVKYFIYQKYLFLYFILNQTVIVIHYYYLGRMDLHEYYYASSVHISAFIIYMYFSRNMSLGLIKTLMKVIIIIGIVTSVVAIIQFFYDRAFMRMAPYSRAYGQFFRATGFFPTGYDHGLHLITSIFVAHFFVKNHFIRMALISLYSLAIFILLSRGIYLALVIAAVYYIMSVAKNKAALIVINVLIVGIIIWSAFSTYDLGSKIITSDFGGVYEERLMSDTATPRAHYYMFVIAAIPDEFLLGYGSRKRNEVYRRGMIAANHVGWADGTRGGIHNMFLEIGFLRGVIVLYVIVAFFIYLLKFIKDYSNKTQTNFLYIIGANIVALIAYKMTTASFVRSYCGMMSMVYAGMVTGIYYYKIDISQLRRKFY